MFIRIVCVLFTVGLAVGIPPLERIGLKFLEKHDDVNVPERSDSYQAQDEDHVFRYKWVGLDGSVFSDEELEGVDKSDYLEVSSTELLPELHEAGGVNIVSLMLRYMPDEVFIELAKRGSVGLFTAEEGTTIFPEYEHLRDRPECEGTCAGACSDTCTSDGRKYDELAGLGGIRATCVDDNYMCTDDDPYGHTDNILVHEFSHTIHQYALPHVPGDWWDKIWAAYLNARANEIWNLNSYAMSNHLEYFAEAAGVFFNVNHHWSSTGGMNRCGKGPEEFCETEEEAREFLQQEDPMVYEALVYTFTDGRDQLSSDLEICQY